jgi:antitoxin HicB
MSGMDNRFMYPAAIKPDEEDFLYVSFRDLPEAYTDGRSLEEAMREAADCLDEAIAGRIRREEDIPPPSRPRRGERLVAVPPLTAAKAALYLALRESGTSKLALARRLGIDQKDMRRLCDPRHRSRIGAIADALRALGKALVIDVRDAA